MKSEDRIIELLAEYMKLGDQLKDSADRTERSIEVMSRALAANDVKFNGMNEKFNSMNEKFNHEIKQLHEHDIRLREDQNRMREEQAVLLRELVSISKRVAVVEEKR